MYNHKPMEREELGTGCALTGRTDSKKGGVKVK